MSQPVTAAGVTVSTHGAAIDEARRQVEEAAVADGVPSALIDKDPTLWGPQARHEAAKRLGWLDLPRTSRALLARLEELRAGIADDGLDHIVLAGMGGSSLAPEVITRSAGVPLTVLDTTDPGQIRRALDDRLDRTLVVVSSKSGGTVETDSHRRTYLRAFRDAGLSRAEAARRVVVVTDPGSPFARLSDEEGYRATVLADPNVGGRYSALSAFGLVPSALAGADVAAVLDSAAALLPALDRLRGNPGLALGAALGGAGLTGRDKVVITGSGSGIVGFGDWAEQLLAESTGKHGRGLLPVVVGGAGAPGTAAQPDSHPVMLSADAATGGPDLGTSVSGPLGAQFLLWEYATAVAGRALGIDPFDQPNVQESKDNTNRLLEQAGDGPLPEGQPAFTDGPVAVFAEGCALAGVTDLGGAVKALLGSIPDRGYLAVMAYLDRSGDAAAAGLRDALARRTPRPVTFGWGPRFLHSTGQYHKGGPQDGVFLQVTGEVVEDLPVPGRPFTFGRLQRAQALGDLRALAGRGRPTIRLHLTDRAAGLAALIDAVEAT